MSWWAMWTASSVATRAGRGTVRAIPVLTVSSMTTGPRAGLRKLGPDRNGPP